jgi:hypothetical protein
MVFLGVSMIGRHSEAPLIGMPARMDPGKDSQHLSRHYADAVLAVGIPRKASLTTDSPGTSLKGS